MKLLAVDDDPVFLDILVPLLNSLGKDDVTVALSGSDALAKLDSASQEFDCILLDIQMPGMNGVDLCRHIRNLPAYRRTPILMITTMTGKRSIDDAFSAGATDYINKPLERVELAARLGMVERLLDERHRTAALERQMDQRSGGVMIEVDFETPIPIPGFDRGIEYLALENYLLTLGNKRMHSTAAFGISVTNAGPFFRKASVSNFVDMLGDVASAISDAVKTERMMISYAGSGNFVCVLSDDIVSDPAELEIEIQSGVDDFISLYVGSRLPTPKIKVGQLVRSSFFSMFKPTSILDRSIALVETGQETKARSRWAAA
jgi:CheY-like chemotaxis protein